MNGIWGQFVGNLAFVSLSISIWAHLSIWLRRRFAGHEKILFGLMAGIASIGSILLAVEFSSGIHMDLRYAPLALAGMFGGPLAAAIGATLAAIFRIALGGVAAPDGVVAIIAVTGMGLSVNLLMKKRSPTLLHVVVLGAAVGILLVVLMAVLPTLSKSHALATMGLPMAAMNCAATIVCGFIVLTTQHLELERRMLETAFSQSPDYLYVKDRDSRFITVNENMIRLYRMRTTAEMVGLSDFDLHPRRLAEELYHREQEVMRTGVPLIDSLEHIEGLDLLASKVPLRDREGRVIGLAGVTRDITERTALERELRESKNLLSHAMAGMSDGFAMFDRDGYLLFCNEQYRSAFPLSGRARVIGAHISDIVRCVAETRERLNVPYESVDEWISEATSTLHCNKDEEVQHQNGDWHSIRTRLAPGGTAMVVVSDITVMKQAEMALRLSAEQLKNLAETDGLTGLVNRRAFDEAFVREAARCARINTPLSLLMIDIDRFKAYNDTYGHPAGDQCLRLVSKCLLNSAQRPADIVARYGGEEFVVLLPDTDDKAAAIVAEKFAGLLGEEKVVHAQSEFGSVTASIGIASAIGHILQAEPGRLLSEADAALYEAKMLGRNRILARVLADAADVRLAG
ncbi:MULTISPECIES: diguanylate cyclase [Sinorhizobium]|uniref:diguanylate cyclase n=1 Tax=Sinorhizobium americanum TaxID=194963 RepID=A0A2S3YG93_9HYPH|nr:MULTISPECIES: diguanylate cyclase [Sinorhizobium]PDT40168.1 histidine kinase [Sinorhizobium sp. FG01]POH25254.1 histidine kinase [Sinorhizobium americanum]